MHQHHHHHCHFGRGDFPTDFPAPIPPPPIPPFSQPRKKVTVCELEEASLTPNHVVEDEL